MKVKKCSYKYCKNPESIDPESAVYDGGKYYHLSCYERKQAKLEVFDLFCEYVSNNESGLFIKKKISDYIDKEGYSPSYVLFTMQFIIKNKIPLKSIFGLKIVMNQKRVKDAYEKCVQKYQTTNINTDNKEFEFKKENKGRWQDLIG